MLQKLLLKSQIWPGVAAAAFSSLSFNAPLSFPAVAYSAFVLFGTASAYAYMRWVKHSAWGTLPQKGLRRSGHFFLAFALLHALLALGFLALLGMPALWLALLPAAAVALLYPIVFPFPLRGFSALRSLPMLKLFLISLSWAYITFFLPRFIEGALLDPWLYVDFGARVLFVAALTVPFDLRDLAEDPPQLRTLPQILGPQASLRLAQSLLFLLQSWTLLSFFGQRLPLAEALAWLLGLELAYRMIGSSLQRGNRGHYIDFWLEAIPLYLWILLVLARGAPFNAYF